MSSSTTTSSTSTSVTYSSTRGEQKHFDFRTVVMQGLAHDRGLFVPDTIPQVSTDELESWRTLSYPQLAVNVIAKFVKDDQIPFDKLTEIVTKSCSSFRHEDVTPIIHIGGHAILELFHGPTFAFKDVALQMLGNFFEYFLEASSNEEQKLLTILGATSGDTGSAAIAGLRGKKGIHCVILFPDGKVSPIQERQMTTVPDTNIHCVAVTDNATFDDCQDIVKASFNTPQFRTKVSLGAINSINWCRVLAQTTYYFWSYLRITDNKELASKEVNFSVPTGNFGDILAGFYTKLMGVPIGKLIVATNENDILYRFFTKGEYHRHTAVETISPSMDICVSSNFERYLYYLAGNDSNILNQWMDEFETTKKLTISGELLQKAQIDFDAARTDTDQALDIIKQYHTKYNYLLCPHSACGVSAIHQLNLVTENTVALATAHHGKFPTPVSRAIAPIAPDCPPQLHALKTMPTRRAVFPNNLQSIQSFVEECVLGTTTTATTSTTVDVTTTKKNYWTDALATVALTSIIVGAVAVVAQIIITRRKIN